MPARIKPSRTLSLEQAGPMVQTIFVRRIPPNVHESVGESTKEEFLVLDRESRLLYVRTRNEELYFGSRSFQSRIEEIAQSITEQVDAKHGNENAETGK